MVRKWSRDLRSHLKRRLKFWLCLLTVIVSLVFGSFFSSTFATTDSQVIPIPADVLIQQSQQRYELGQFSEAVILLKQAIADYRQKSDFPNLVMSLSNLALVQHRLGQWDAANAAIAESLALLQRSPNASLLAQTLSVQGQLQLDQGQTELALNAWQSSETIYVQLQDPLGVTQARVNQAQALRVLGFYKQALDRLTALKEKVQVQPASNVKAIALRSLGNALALSGIESDAEAVLQDSLAIARELQDAEQISAALLSLGNLARLRRASESAIAYYQQASLHPSHSRIQAQLNLLALWIETQQKSKARQLATELQPTLSKLPPNRTTFDAQINFAQSLARLDPQNAETAARLLSSVAQQARKLRDQRIESYAYGTLAELYEQQERWTEAQRLNEQALRLAHSGRDSDIAYLWHWHLGRVLRQQQQWESAIAAYDSAVLLLKSLRTDLVAINSEVQFSFRKSIEPVYRELMEVLLRSPDVHSRNQNLEKARDLIEALQLKEIDNFFREACLDRQPVALDSVVDQVATNTPMQRAAVIYPIVLPDSLHVIAKLPKQETLRSHVVPETQINLEKTLVQLRAALLQPDPNEETRRLSKTVYDWLIRPLEADLKRNGVNTIVFVLDGAFRSVPIAALYDGQQYLIEKGYAIALNLGLQLQSPKAISQEPLRVLAAGLTKLEGDLARSFEPLPGVAAELSAIEAAGISVTELRDRQFTEANLSRQVNEKPYNVVHLATHGQFSSQADQTFIVAADKRIFVKEFDQLIRDRQRTQAQPIELLLMSACETARGDERATLGLAGVAVKAGARSTIASLWKVTDDSTAVLVKVFYEQLKGRKVSKAEALRVAQLELLRRKELGYTAPRYWSPFILIGNWL